jgi:hypothetical protein
VDSSGLPVAVSVASASPDEVTLVEQALEARPVEEKPERLIAGREHATPTRSTRSWGAKASSRAPHTGGTARSHRPRTGASRDATRGAGR